MLQRSPGGGHVNLLQYSCLENPMDRGAWWATVDGVTNSWTRLKQLSMHKHRHMCVCVCVNHGRFPGEGNSYPLLILA